MLHVKRCFWVATLLGLHVKKVQEKRKKRVCHEQKPWLGRWAVCVHVCIHTSSVSFLSLPLFLMVCMKKRVLSVHFLLVQLLYCFIPHLLPPPNTSVQFDHHSSPLHLHCRGEYWKSVSTVKLIVSLHTMCWILSQDWSMKLLLKELFAVFLGT